MKEFKFLFNKLPFYIIFYPTSRCNANCPHCYNYKRQSDTSLKEELTLGEIDKISKNLNHIKVLTISGGEPFLRNDLTEIISIFYKNNGIQYVSFHTNAFLSDRVISTISAILNKFADIQIIVCISVDGIGEIHNRFRGVEGGFDKILETIARLKELKAMHKNLNLLTSTIFSHSTMNSFPDTIKFIQDNINVVKPTLSFIRGSVKDASEKTIDFARYQRFYQNFKHKVDKNINMFSPMAFKEALEMVANRILTNNYQHKRKSIRCQAGLKLIVIYENGDVYPCETLGHKFGNLKDVKYDVKQLLFSAKGRRIIEMIEQEKSCYCTWENIIPVNLFFSPAYYPVILYEWFRLFVLRCY